MTPQGFPHSLSFEQLQVDPTFRLCFFSPRTFPAPYSRDLTSGSPTFFRNVIPGYVPNALTL